MSHTAVRPPTYAMVPASMIIAGRSDVPDRYCAGETVQQFAQAHGVCTATIRSDLQRAGVQARPNRGEDNGSAVSPTRRWSRSASATPTANGNRSRQRPRVEPDGDLGDRHLQDLATHWWPQGTRSPLDLVGGQRRLSLRLGTLAPSGDGRRQPPRAPSSPLPQARPRAAPVPLVRPDPHLEGGSRHRSPRQRQGPQRREQSRPTCNGCNSARASACSSRGSASDELAADP